jgi:hypothetical protein
VQGRRWTGDERLPDVTDEAMRAGLATSREYSVVVLRDGPRPDHPDRDRLVWEHGRRNFRLRAAGLLAVVLPIRDASDVDGVGVFDLPVEDTRAVLEADPAVQAGVFRFDVHPGRGFPGDRLPAAASPARKDPPDAAQPVERFHADGSLWARGHLLDGEEHGDWEWFRPDGTRMRSGSFDRGAQVGLWTFYDEHGVAVKRTRFPGPAGSPTDHTADDPYAGEV